MEPPKPEIHSLYTMASPRFSQEDALEYERLLAERFQVDPDLPKEPAASALQDQRENRIKELHMKIYGALP